MSILQLYCDGGSRSNPGPSGLGVAAYDIDVNGKKDCIFEKGVYLEDCSNNFAEYMALIQGLNYALASDYQHIEMYSDSKLIVEQVSGRWKVKSEDLKDLAHKAMERIRQIRKLGRQLTITWVPREKNVHADSLANLAMDRKATAEYRRDPRQADKMQKHLEAMMAHEELVKKVVSAPRRSQIRLLRESFEKVISTWSNIKT